MFLDPFTLADYDERHSGSNAREGIFCFWTYLSAEYYVPDEYVLMPARAFFVFGLI